MTLEQIEKERITIKDIENYFPYLKNLEEQVIDPDDFCDFQTEVKQYEEQE